MESSDTKPIGGYFSWEFRPSEKFTLHKNAFFVNSGRHALEYILRNVERVSKVFIPYYTCDAVLDVITKLGLTATFYPLNENLEIGENIKLAEGEYLIYTNYFGIKDLYVSKISQQYGTSLIIDNAQALYCSAIADHQIYSPRKFLGMPDGGIAVTPLPRPKHALPKSFSFDKCKHLLKRIELAPSEGYADFKETSKLIAEEPLSEMSDISINILTSVDLNHIKAVRRRNFSRLHQALRNINTLTIPGTDTFVCPMVYPFKTSSNTLRQKLINNQIFVAIYWPNVLDWCKSTKQLEYTLVNQIIPLPIDQRYDDRDMDRIINIIKGESV